MRGKHVRGALLLVMLVVAAVALPGAGQTKPPEDDGSGYTWPGASILTVDIKPWGAGYVRSEPYFVDCPLACIRPLERGRELTLVAHVTPGHKFESWEGACAGQGNPCKLTAAGSAVDVTAVYSGHYVPPAPPAPPTPPVPSAPSAAPTVNPALSVEVPGGDCDPGCFSMAFCGTGFHPNSAMQLTFAYSSPRQGPGTDASAGTTDGAGSWTRGYYENCEFDGGTYSGPVVIEVTATDEQGASASTQVNGECPASEA